MTAGRGVDLILDIVGGDYIARDLAALAIEGRLVVIGFMGGDTATIDFRRILGRRLTITGSTLRPRSRAKRRGRSPPRCAGKCGRCSNRAPSNQSSTRRFPCVMPPQHTGLMESSEHVGKIVLVT